jgi:hypothetical protein
VLRLPCRARRPRHGGSHATWVSDNAQMAISVLVAAPPRLVAVASLRSSAGVSVMARVSSEALSTRKINRPMPSPSGTVMPGARGVNGVSRNEIASTMTGHANGTAYLQGGTVCGHG